MVARLIPFALVGCLSIGAFAVLMTTASSRRQDGRASYPVSRETTYLTEPVDERGYLIVHQAIERLQAEGVTRDNNAAVLLIEAMGGQAEGRELTEICERLEIELPIRDPTYRPAAFARQGRNEIVVLQTEQDRALEGPWTRDDAPSVVDWIETNAEPLAKIAEGVRRPQYWIPRVGGEEGVWMILLSDVQQYRDIARCLQARVHLAIGEDRFDDAWADLLTMHRLARVVSRGPTLIEKLVGFAIEGMACASDRIWLDRLPEMGPDLAEIRRQLDELGAIESLARSLKFERMMIVDLANRMDQGIIPEAITDDGRLNSLQRLRFDWELVLRRSQTHYDRLEECLLIEDARLRRRQLEAIDAELNEAVEGLDQALESPVGLAARALFGGTDRTSDQVAAMLVRLMAGSILTIDRAENRIVADRAIVRLAIRLAERRVAGKPFPETLEGLVEGVDGERTIDPNTGEPFAYRLTATEVVLYQFGGNGIDDGGPGQGDDVGLVWKR